MSGIPNGMQPMYRQQYVEQVNQHVGVTSSFSVYNYLLQVNCI